MREPVEIRFGERIYTIRPLTLGQVEAIERAVRDEQRPRIIKIAFSRDHAFVDLDDIGVTASEIRIAVAAILRLTGKKSDNHTPESMTADDRWRDIRCRLITNGAVSVDHVDDVEWWRVLEILEFWRDEPPMRDLVEMIARFLGYSPSSRRAVTDSESAFAGLMSDHPDGCVRGI